MVEDARLEAAPGQPLGAPGRPCGRGGRRVGVSRGRALVATRPRRHQPVVGRAHRRLRRRRRRRRRRRCRSHAHLARTLQSPPERFVSAIRFCFCFRYEMRNGRAVGFCFRFDRDDSVKKKTRYRSELISSSFMAPFIESFHFFSVPYWSLRFVIDFFLPSPSFD